MPTVTIDPTKVRPLEGALTRPQIMAEASQLGRMTYISDDMDNPLNKAKVSQSSAAEAASASGAVGMIVAGSRHASSGAVVESEQVTVLYWGPVWVGDADLDVTQTYFLADDAGLLGDSAGTVTRLVARPLAKEVLFIDGVSLVEPTSD